MNLRKIDKVAENIIGVKALLFHRDLSDRTPVVERESRHYFRVALGHSSDILTKKF